MNLKTLLKRFSSLDKEYWLGICVVCGKKRWVCQRDIDLNIKEKK
jgi:hypothetical protein